MTTQTDMQPFAAQSIIVNVPALSKLQQEALAAPRVLALAAEFQVTNPEQLALANRTLQELLRAKDALEKDRTDVTGPLHKTKAWIDAQYKPVRDMLDHAAGLIRGQVESFVVAQRREQERAFQAAQQAHAQGDHAGTALALNVSAAIVTTAPAGTTVQEYWEAEVFNPAIVPHEYLCPDVVKIQAHAANTMPAETPAPIPGVRFNKKTRSIVRR